MHWNKMAAGVGQGVENVFRISISKKKKKKKRRRNGMKEVAIGGDGDLIYPLLGCVAFLFL